MPRVTKRAERPWTPRFKEVSDGPVRPKIQPAVNQCLFVGQIMDEPHLRLTTLPPLSEMPASRVRAIEQRPIDERSSWTRYHLRFRLRVLTPGKGRDLNLYTFARGVAGNSAAEFVKKYDSVMVRGSLFQWKHWKKVVEGNLTTITSHDRTYLRGTQLYWLPVRFGQRWRRTHVTIPMAEYARYKRLEKESGLGAFNIDPEELERRLGQLSFDGAPRTDEEVAEIRKAVEELEGFREQTSYDA